MMINQTRLVEAIKVSSGLVQNKPWGKEIYERGAMREKKGLVNRKFELHD
jgi:hypothetical protein